MADTKKIYLACPYSDPADDIKRWRFDQVNRRAASLMRQGFLVFSPISHTHPIALAGELSGGWEFWEQYDRTFIEWADELWVLCLGGWKQSVGVQAEIKIAKALGKKIQYLI